MVVVVPGRATYLRTIEWEGDCGGELYVHSGHMGGIALGDLGWDWRVGSDIESLGGGGSCGGVGCEPEPSSLARARVIIACPIEISDSGSTSSKLVRTRRDLNARRTRLAKQAADPDRKRSPGRHQHRRRREHTCRRNSTHADRNNSISVAESEPVPGTLGRRACMAINVCVALQHFHVPKHKKAFGAGFGGDLDAVLCASRRIHHRPRCICIYLATSASSVHASRSRSARSTKKRTRVGGGWKVQLEIETTNY